MTEYFANAEQRGQGRDTPAPHLRADMIQDLDSTSKLSDAEVGRLFEKMDTSGNSHDSWSSYVNQSSELSKTLNIKKLFVPYQDFSVAILKGRFLVKDYEYTFELNLHKGQTRRVFQCHFANDLCDNLCEYVGGVVDAKNAVLIFKAFSFTVPLDLIGIII